VEQLSATRSELLSRRAQIALATQGRDLLKEKRAALMREFERTSSAVLDALETLGRDATESRRTLRDTVVFDGAEALSSAALAASGSVAGVMSTRNVAGVAVVELEHDPVSRARTERGYSLAATTPRVDAVATSFERQVDLLLDVAATELSLRRVAGEITRTTRRVNALEHVVVPRLRGERDTIQMVLAERELEERVRLRRARAAGRRRKARTGAAA
jgi:V/A-type H+-transporting ATPase subunit D